LKVPEPDSSDEFSATESEEDVPQKKTRTDGNIKINQSTP